MSTQFSLKDPNPGVWFKFNEDDPESGEIRIRVVNSAQREEMQKACVKNKVEYKHGQRFEYTTNKDALFSKMLWDYSIVEWVRLEDDDGTPIECSSENKVKLMKENVGFAQFVSTCLEIITETEESRVSMVEKNLMSGSADSVVEKSQTVKSAKK
jgi:hypothetical protein